MANQYYISIILARKGSKGIKNKNLIKIKGKPLIFWSIKAATSSKKIYKVFVSSDDKKILNYATKYGAHAIHRPKKLSDDLATSESGWLHACKIIEKKIDFKYVVALQATSPYREKKDLDSAIKKFEKTNADSLFSAHKTHDTNLWHKENGKFLANYNYLARKPRQKNKPKFLENGSFYIFKKDLFFKKKNRLFGKIATYDQNKRSSIQIDDFEDLKIMRKII